MLPARHQGNKGQGGHLTRSQHPLHQLRQGFDSLFDRFFGDWFAPAMAESEALRFWDFDMTDNDNEVVVKAELPGFEPHDLDLQVTNDMLTIKAEHRQENDQGQSFNSYRRSITLPSGVDTEKAKASYRNGVLELHLPKTERARAKRISIEGAQAQPNQGQGGKREEQGRQNQGAQGLHDQARGEEIQVTGPEGKDGGQHGKKQSAKTGS
jgi:HSP20 family protein